MTGEGWIKLHRTIVENEFYFSERFTKMQAWTDLLILATHKNRTLFLRGVEIKLKCGELCYSQESLAKRWKWNQRTVNKYLKTLENRQMIQTRITNITTIITILNWQTYQDSTEQSTDQNTERVQSRIRTNKNDKNVKNGKNIIWGDFPKLDNDPFREKWEEWIKFRSEIHKPLKESTIKKQLNFLTKQPDPIAIIEKSITNGWQGLFEINGTTKRSNQAGQNPNAERDIEGRKTF